MSGKINGRVIVDNSIGPDKLSEEYLVVSNGGTIDGNLTVTGNTTLSETATYKGSEIANHDDIDALGGRIDEANAAIDTKASIEDVNAALALKQDNLTAGENITIEGNVIDSVTKIAESDRILTYDTAGLKSNISVEVDGNEITFYGKNDPDGEPYVLAEFNVLQSQIIEDVYIDDATKELVITFVVDGDPGTETVRVDLTDFIDVYEGTEYIDITGQDISLKYEELRDKLINDGMALQGDLPTNYVTTDTAQTITGIKRFNSPVTAISVVPESSGAGSVGTSQLPYNTGYINSITSNSVSLTEINTTIGSGSYIGTENVPFSDAHIRNIYSSNIRRRQDSEGSIGTSTNKYKNAYFDNTFSSVVIPHNSADESYIGGEIYPYTYGYFKNLYKNGVEVATTTDVSNAVTLTGDQEISGVKTFDGVPVFNAGSATFKTPLLSGGSISAGADKLVSDVGFEAPNMTALNVIPKATANSSIGTSEKPFSTSAAVTSTTNTIDHFRNTTTSRVGSSSYPFANGYFGRITTDSIQLAGVTFSPSNYVTLSGAQSITGTKTFSNTQIFAAINVNYLRANDGSSTIGEASSPFLNGNISYLRTTGIRSSGGTTSFVGESATPFINGYFTNLYQDGVKVATVNDIPTQRSASRQVATGQTSVTIGEGKAILNVNYDRMCLFESDYSYIGGVVTVTNTELTSIHEGSDKIEVTFM